MANKRQCMRLVKGEQVLSMIENLINELSSKRIKVLELRDKMEVISINRDADAAIEALKDAIENLVDISERCCCGMNDTSP